MPKKRNIIAFYSTAPVLSSAFHKEEQENVPYKKSILIPEGPLVNTFDAADIESGSIAYHPVFGDVHYRSSWRFSTENFIAGLLAADENPSICAHLIHVNSPGGDAYGCHEAFGVVSKLKKPCYGVIDSLAGSAGYYLVAACDKIFAESIFSEIGCIGIMCVVYDDEKMLAEWGLKEHMYISNYTPLKNKVFNDAMKGDGEEYVKRFLDPLALQFIDDVKSVRPDISEDALKGETYYSADAVSAGLIDGVSNINEVIATIIAEVKTPELPIDLNSIVIL